MKYHVKKTALALGLMLTLPVMAQSAVTPQVIHTFDNAYGVFAPPVWSPQQQLIIGSTLTGGESYSVPGYPGIPGYEYTALESGRAYSLALDGSGLASAALGSGAGHFFTNHLLSRNGDVWGGSTYAASSPVAAEALRWGAITRLGENLAVTSYRPEGLAVDKQFQLRGQLAEDSSGNVYAADGYAAPNTVDKTNRLLRVKPDGTVETVIDYIAYAKPFRTQGSTVRHWLAKGNSPYAIVWSDNDDALYLISSTGTGTATEPHAGQPAVYCEEPPEGGEYFRPDCRDGTVLRGHLIRISGEALRGELPVAEDAIEILFHFTVGTGGEVATTDSSALASVIEDGDYLYGISQSVKDESGTSGQGIWRIRKSGLAEGITATETFTTVHRFAPVADQDRFDNPLADTSADIIGTNIYGPLVLAADGNIYGTTLSDDRETIKSGSASRPTYTPGGAGTIYRIVVGTEADRSDDKLEQLYSFVEAETGKAPKGLSVGPFQNGKQIIIGATAAGTESGNGGLFTFGVTPLPGSVQLDASAADVKTGDTVTLSWTATNAQTCSLSASASDVTDWAGDVELSGSKDVVAVTGTTAYSVSCAAFNGEVLTASATVIATAPVVTPEPSTPTPSTPKKSSGGGNSSLGLLLMLGALLSGALLLRVRPKRAL